MIMMHRCRHQPTVSPGEDSAMKLICGIALAVAILIQPTSSKADYSYAGMGAYPCSKIVQDDPKIEQIMMTWAQGYMSGANMSLTNGQYRDLAAMTVEAQEESLRNYCDQHPTAELIKAVMDLYVKLPLKPYTPPASR